MQLKRHLLLLNILLGALCHFRQFLVDFQEFVPDEFESLDSLKFHVLSFSGLRQRLPGTFNGHALLLEEMVHFSDFLNVLFRVLPDVASRLLRLDAGELLFPESQSDLRDSDNRCYFADGVEKFEILIFLERQRT